MSMIITFMRQDPDGNPVKVEISKDDKTGKPIRIRRETTFLKHNIKVRSDVYWQSEPEEFKKCLDEEISFYEGIVNTLKNWLADPEQETLQPTKMLAMEEDGLVATAARLQRMKHEGQT